MSFITYYQRRIVCKSCVEIEVLLLLNKNSGIKNTRRNIIIIIFYWTNIFKLVKALVREFAGTFWIWTPDLENFHQTNQWKKLCSYTTSY